MPKQVRLRRGTTAQHVTFAGALGEVTFDTTKKTLICHDGATAGGVPLALEVAQIVKAGNLVWVDAVNGNDSTGQRGRLQLPFLTLGAAKTAAVSGDTIVVLPGTFSEKNLAKNGVNWHFHNGAVVNYSGAVGGGIFDTNTFGSACTFVVSGNGVFKVTSEPSPVPLVKSGFGGDNIKIDCDRIEAIGSALDAAGTVLIRCNEMKSTSASLDAKQKDALATFLALCRDRVPLEPDKPPQPEIEQEIAELEYRLEHLRKSLEVPPGRTPQ